MLIAVQIQVCLQFIRTWGENSFSKSLAIAKHLESIPYFYNMHKLQSNPHKLIWIYIIYIFIYIFYLLNTFSH